MSVRHIRLDATNSATDELNLILENVVIICLTEIWVKIEQ